MSSLRARIPRLTMMHVAITIVLYCAVVAAVQPRRTYDLWWHLETGELIASSGAVPHEDRFTYTRQGERWIAHEWAWEVPMYLMYNRWGHAGLMVLRLIVTLGTATLLVRLCLGRDVTPPALMAAGALAVFVARPLFNDRPQALSALFFAGILCLLQQSERGRERWVLLAPLLMIPWVNIHGGFIFGPALLGLYAAVKVPQWVGQYRAGRDLSPSPIILIAAIVLACLACLVNPNGIEGATYPLQYVVGGHAWHQTIITEYQSPDFSDIVFVFLALLMVASVAVLGASRRRICAWDVVLIVLFMFMALRWKRMVAMYALAAAPVVAMHLSDLTREANIGTSSWRAVRTRTVHHTLVVVALAVLAAAAVPPALGRVEEAWASDYPVECVKYVQRTALKGRMFNTYRWGGYLIFNLWPQHHVFVDGRADVAGRDLMEDYQTAKDLKDGWQDVLERYEIDWVLMDTTSPLCRALDLHEGWRRVCDEESAELYVRVGSVADRSAGEP